MKKQKAICILNTQLRIANNLLSNNSEFKQWKKDTDTAIRHTFLKNSEHLEGFRKITYKTRERYTKRKIAILTFSKNNAIAPQQQTNIRNK